MVLVFALYNRYWASYQSLLFLELKKLDKSLNNYPKFVQTKQNIPRNKCRHQFVKNHYWWRYKYFFRFFVEGICSSFELPPIFRVLQWMLFHKPWYQNNYIFKPQLHHMRTEMNIRRWSLSYLVFASNTSVLPQCCPISWMNSWPNHQCIKCYELHLAYEFDLLPKPLFPINILVCNNMIHLFDLFVNIFRQKGPECIFMQLSSTIIQICCLVL